MRRDVPRADMRGAPIPGADGSGAEVKVWDPFVRVFHWVTVACVAVAAITTEPRWLHEGAGYIVLPLVVARILWGFVGSRHARFTDFVTRPATIRAYLRDLRAGRARRYIGHNPAGGAMVVLLMTMLVLVAGSGALQETDMFFGVEWVSNVHAALANLMLWMVGAHIVGAIVSSVLHRENLVRAMFTGRKPAVLPSKHEFETGAAAGPRLNPR
jgi:cytochrome b